MYTNTKFLIMFLIMNSDNGLPQRGRRGMRYEPTHAGQALPGGGGGGRLSGPGLHSPALQPAAKAMAITKRLL